MTKTTRNLLITVALLLLLCLVLTIVSKGQGMRVLFLIFTLVWGLLLLWLAIREIRGWVKRKNASPEIPKVNPPAGAAADSAFGVPASTACGIESETLRQKAAMRTESEGDALNGLAERVTSAAAQEKAAAPKVPEMPKAPAAPKVPEAQKAPAAPAKPPAAPAPKPPEADKTTAAPASAYIGHVESRKFHLSTCQTLPNEKNRIYFKSREEAVARKFTPCSYCNP